MIIQYLRKVGVTNVLVLDLSSENENQPLTEEFLLNRRS